MSKAPNCKSGFTGSASNIIKASKVPMALIAPTLALFDALPDNAWLREAQLVRSCKKPTSYLAPLPFSAPTLWRMVKAGKFPKPTKLSAGVTAWQVGQVRAWLAAQPMA